MMTSDDSMVSEDGGEYPETEEKGAPEPAMGSIWVDSSGSTHISTGGGKWSSVPHTITGGTITGGTVSTKSITITAKPPPTVLAGPTRRPKKLLIAFLGDDDDVEWCAKVDPDDINLRLDKDEPAPRLELGFWLIDAG